MTGRHSIIPSGEDSLSSPALHRPLTRRRALTLGATLVGGALLGSGATAAAATTRPTGSGTVRYEDLYRAGDDIRRVLAKVGTRVLTLPEGLFEVRNFQDPAQAIRIPPNVRGIVGSGRGTVIRIKPRTSTFGNNRTAVPARGANQLFVLRMMDGRGQLLRNFKVEGTEQGHLYNGVMVGRSSSPTMDGLYITGVPGDANYPPGETVSIDVYRGSGSTILNTEVDGRRADGVRYASSPIGYNFHTGGVVRSSYVHHTRTGGGGIAYYKSSDCKTYDLRSEYIGSGRGNQAGHPLNHEGSTRITHVNPTLIVNRTTGGNTGVHVTWDNDMFDGRLTIQNPTWDDPHAGHGRLLIQTHHPYGAGQKQVTAPTVTDARGAKLAVTWLA